MDDFHREAIIEEFNVADDCLHCNNQLEKKKKKAKLWQPYIQIRPLSVTRYNVRVLPKKKKKDIMWEEKLIHRDPKAKDNKFD